jgi:tetratricopeptide (TPR) repeat protein
MPNPPAETTPHRPTGRDALRRKRSPPWKRLVVGLTCIIVVTLAAIGLSVWWEDRPLAAIERALDLKDYNEALLLTDKYLKDSPYHVRALDQKARALAGLERWSEAERLFNRIGGESFASRRAWSQALLHEHRWNEALALLTPLNEQAPDDADILHELCACEASLGYFDESIEAAKRLTRISGHVRRGRFLLGMLHYKRGNNRLAIEAWKPLFEEGPDLSDLQASPAEFLLAYGRALLDDGRPAEALEPLKRAVQLDPAAEALDALAETHDDLGDRAKAAALWEQAVARSPDNRAAREGLARAALEKKAPAEALRWLGPLLTKDDLQSSTAFLAQRCASFAGDKETATTWTARANALRDREKKIAAVEQALRDTPRSFWARCVRAHKFASEGNFSQALALAEELRRQKPDEPFARDLAEAIRNHKPLPSLELIPLKQY